MIHGIKQIYYSKYQLNPKAALNAKSQNSPRYGALLRVDFEVYGTGYSDCYPWQELGDLPLDEQLLLLAQNQLTPLTKKSIYFAEIDAQYRSKSTSVFSTLSFPKNHLIIPYESLNKEEIIRIKLEGFDFIKLKFGKNLKKEVTFIKEKYPILKEKNIKLRLDFNSTISINEAKAFFSEIRGQLDIIDFVEDPCEFIFKGWQEIQCEFDVHLALDRKPEEFIAREKKYNDDSSPAFKVIVIKPAIEDSQSFFTIPPQQRVIFTSYMDHPLGQLCAIYEAESFYNKFPRKREHCGFLTHSLFEPNQYSKHLKTEGSVLFAKLGAGFGFEELLIKENWIPVSQYLNQNPKQKNLDLVNRIKSNL